VAAGLQDTAPVNSLKYIAANNLPFLTKGQVWKETVKIEENQPPDSETYWSYEDAPSNWLGAEFYLYHYTNDENLTKSIDLLFFARKLSFYVDSAYYGFAKPRYSSDLVPNMELVATLSTACTTPACTSPRELPVRCSSTDVTIATCFLTR
jgi:hypothetical protein